jgi:hypothetical protein
MLYNNQLAGTIPSTVGQMTALQQLCDELCIAVHVGFVALTKHDCFSIAGIFLTINWLVRFQALWGRCRRWNNCVCLCLCVSVCVCVRWSTSCISWIGRSLSRNQLTGSIPNTIGQLSMLQNVCDDLELGCSLA